jgi:Fe-S cluster assembly ATP-binding protein
MLTIKNLHAYIGDKEILKGLSLELRAGEIHAIMGPNGTGKSTLSAIIAGKTDYHVTSGEILFNGKDILSMTADERAREGVFLAFQYPVEIPGVSTTNFMKAALNAQRKHHGLEPISAKEFLALMNEKRQLVELNKSFTSRSINEGFSGGEKKRNEIFQMAMLAPKLAILDETDSGLDIDALRIVADGVNKLRSPDNAFLIITHYQRLLNYIVPDYVHIMYDGRIVKTGDKGLAFKMEERGYDWIKEELAQWHS